MYKNPVTDPSFSLCVKDTHMVFGSCNAMEDGYVDISFFVTINTPSGARDHAMDFHVAPGATNPFHYARFI